jgi:hypothetical protein
MTGTTRDLAPCRTKDIAAGDRLGYASELPVRMYPTPAAKPASMSGLLLSNRTRVRVASGNDANGGPYPTCATASGVGAAFCLMTEPKACRVGAAAMS